MNHEQFIEIVFLIEMMLTVIMLSFFQSVALDGTLFQKSGVISGGARYESYLL